MKTRLKIEGMSCEHCVSAVKAALESVPGVEYAEVQLDEGDAIVSHEGADPATLVAAVEEEGYRAHVQ